MKVLIVASANDTAGQGIRIKQAFDKLTDWTVRTMAKVPTYMGYPIDLPYRKVSLEEQYQACDVIHVRNRFDTYDQLAAKFGPKPVVIHYHGTLFRGNPEHFLAQQRERKAVGIVSTLDLWLLAPDELEWLPAVYDIDWLASL